ncbi:MAG: FAD binding domain-containing protein [Alicyclobacillus sp.]|nr:FAD binding domain-containing protein [Alicyclobacillus sp.]
MEMVGQAATLGPRVWEPRDVETAWALHRACHPASCYVAGGTLLQVQWRSISAMPRHLVSLERIDELQAIRPELAGAPQPPRPVTPGVAGLEIGALVRLAALLRHPLVRTGWPLLTAACQSVAAPAVRSRATLGGNVASGVGDTLPALLALDAQAVWFDAGAYAVEPLDAAWSASPSSGQRSPSALLAAIRLPRCAPLPEPSEARSAVPSVPADHAPPPQQLPAPRLFSFRKVGQREAFAPSLLTIAATWDLGVSRASGGDTSQAGVEPTTHQPTGVGCLIGIGSLTGVGDRSPNPLIGISERLQGVRIAVGGADFPPRRLRACERLLEGAQPCPDLWAQLRAAVLEEFHPPERPWASADYRRQVAANAVAQAFAAPAFADKGGGRP